MAPLSGEFPVYCEDEKREFGPLFSCQDDQNIQPIDSPAPFVEPHCLKRRIPSSLTRPVSKAPGIRARGSRPQAPAPRLVRARPNPGASGCAAPRCPASMWRSSESTSRCRWLAAGGCARIPGSCPVVRVAARTGLHFRVLAAFALGYHAVPVAIHVQSRLAAMEQNAAAFVEHRFCVGIAVLVSSHEAGVLVGHLQRIGRLPVIGEPQADYREADARASWLGKLFPDGNAYREFNRMDAFVYRSLMRWQFRRGGQRRTKRKFPSSDRSMVWVCSSCVALCATRRKPHPEDHR